MGSWGLHEVFSTHPNPPQLHEHLITEGLSPDGILSCQRDAAEENEEQDEVGEPGSIDSPVAQHPKPARDRNGMRCCKGSDG